MTILELLQTIADDLSTTVTFVHGEREYQNLVADDLEFPALFVDEPIFSNDTVHDSMYIESAYPLVVLFLEKTDLDMPHDDVDSKIGDMRSLAREFTVRLLEKTDGNGMRYIRSHRNMRRIDIPFAKDKDVVVSGCRLEIEVVPFNTEGFCV